MVQAPVGWHCSKCVRKNARQSPVIRYTGVTRPGLFNRIPVTMSLVVVCVGVYIAEQADPNLLNQGAEWGVGIQDLGQWYRLFTSIFLHVDLLHIALNMLSLYWLGRAVEPALGPWRYLGVFLVSGLGGSVGSYLISSPASAGAGASGAIFGLAGAYFVLARRAALDTSGIVALVAINLIFDFTAPLNISWQAHVGGLVTGLIVAGGFGLGRRGRLKRGHKEALTDVLVLVTVTVWLCLLVLLPAGALNIG